MALSRHRWRLNPVRAAGFTLVELLVVMGIAAILVGLVLGVGRTIRLRTRRETTKLLFGRVENVLEQYKNAIGHLPDAILASRDPGEPSEPLSFSLLAANRAVAQLLLDAGAGGSDIEYEGKTPYVIDAYGRRILIISGGHNRPGLDIWSRGIDGVNDYNESDDLDTGDDVVNWHGR